MPHAEKKIAFDHFHIAQSLTDALNETRKAELLKLEQNLKKEAYQTRYYWLKNPANLKEHHWKKLNELKDSFVNTTLFWYFKERARSIWKGNRVRGAKSSWVEWISLAKAAKIPAL
ncbi:transposase [Marinomonas sp. C1424]|uniref:Transposase n=1 Tax=Marinomonas transparens TaxID=2795388 RepID=A0A934JS59_9GAMM|nr:transposase [Marinomonas transparens]